MQSLYATLFLRFAAGRLKLTATHLVSSVGRVPVCWVGGREFKPRPDHQPIEGLKKLVRSFWLWLKPLSQFRWSRHWAVTLRRWPCLLHPYTSVGRRRKRSRDIVRKILKRVGKFALVSWSIWLMCHHWSGWARLMKHGLKQQHSSPLNAFPWDAYFRSHLSGHWLQVGRVGNPVFLFYFIYLESDIFIVVPCAKILDALGSVWSKIQIRILCKKKYQGIHSYSFYCKIMHQGRSRFINKSSVSRITGK